jgi:hypothetical protein
MSLVFVYFQRSFLLFQLAGYIEGGEREDRGRWDDG